MNIPVIDEKNIFEILQVKEHAYHREYYAFYSSWFGGIIKNPHFMLLPIDDHIVHRGDGVFEGMKVIAGAVYLLDEHLQRLIISANKISLKLAFSFDEMKQIILKTLVTADQENAMVRIYLSRGPGGFSVDPYESVKSQFYVVVTQLKSPSPKKYEEGAVIGKCNINIVPSWLAQAKSCNFIPNVLMKKEAVDRKLDFVIGIDKYGYVTEGASENIIIVDENETIIHPELDYILKGTMMTRACELAQEHGYVTQIKNIKLEDLQSAREIMMAGTSLNLLPVVQYENHKIGNGIPGPISK